MTAFLTAFRIFPNPAKDHIRIHFSEKPCEETSVEVISLLGQVIVSAGQINQTLLNIELPDGNEMYFVRVRSGKENKTFKVFSL